MTLKQGRSTAQATVPNTRMDPTSLRSAAHPCVNQV